MQTLGDSLMNVANSTDGKFVPQERTIKNMKQHQKAQAEVEMTYTALEGRLTAREMSARMSCSEVTARARLDKLVADGRAKKSKRIGKTYEYFRA